MKLLHTSDWHLGKNLYDFSLLEDQRHMLSQLIQRIAGENIDAVLLAGDIYDRPVPSAEAVALYDYFLTEVVGKMGVPVIAVAGNHDSPGRLEFGSRLYRQSGYYIAGQARAELECVTLRDAHGPVNLYLLPYLHPADVRALFGDATVRTFQDAYRVLLERNAARIQTSERNVAIAHGFFSALGGGDTEPLTSDSEINVGGMDIADSACFAPFDYVALGHLHAPQRAGGNHIRYSGSLLKYSLSEQNQKKSCFIVELTEKGSVSVTPLSCQPLRDVRIIRGAFRQLLEPSYQREGNFHDYVFAEIEDGYALYPMEKLRTLFPHILGLRFVGQDAADRPVMGHTATAKLTTEEMFCRFYRDLKGRDIPDSHLALLRDALAELDGRKEETAL